MSALTLRILPLKLMTLKQFSSN